MDRLDRKILRILQEDSTLAVADLAKKVGLSTTPCWRRIQKMEEDGVIRRRVALLDPVKVNTKVTVFVSIRTASHSVPSTVSSGPACRESSAAVLPCITI